MNFLNSKKKFYVLQNNILSFDPSPINSSMKLGVIQDNL